jgi:hypothetical protein
MDEAIAALDPKVEVALVGIISALVSGVISWIVSRGQIKGKIDELMLAQRHQLSQEYLKNARDHTKTIYLPLSSRVSELRKSFGDYIHSNRQAAAMTDFRATVDDFLIEIRKLGQAGSIAYFTADLEKKILSFCSFLNASRDATDPVTEEVFDLHLKTGWLPSGVLEGGLGTRIRRQVVGSSKIRGMDPRLSFNLPMFRASYSV